MLGVRAAGGICLGLKLASTVTGAVDGCSQYGRMATHGGLRTSLGFLEARVRIVYQKLRPTGVLVA